jgi:hypothetical protein
MKGLEVNNRFNILRVLCVSRLRRSGEKLNGNEEG